LELALEEAIVNVIKYAYPESKGKIKIQCIHLPQTGIKVILSDEGIPFNPLLREYKKDVDVIEKVQPVGGLGIFLILSIMDNVDYEFNDGCNILTLTKFFTQ
jgi:anti-sigma regulatory factor (Ser/Thr protein kinase)